MLPHVQSLKTDDRPDSDHLSVRVTTRFHQTQSGTTTDCKMLGHRQAEKWLSWPLQIDANIRQMLRTDQLQALHQHAPQGSQDICGAYQDTINALRPFLTTTCSDNNQGAQISWFDKDCVSLRNNIS
ncbi:hypothetical protein JRQ81_013324, partial [Phrynocephalus forsythii]